MFSGIVSALGIVKNITFNNIYSVEGDLSNNSSNINLNKLFKILNIDIKLKEKDLLISSTNDFSFDLNIFIKLYYHFISLVPRMFRESEN